MSFRRFSHQQTTKPSAISILEAANNIFDWIGRSKRVQEKSFIFQSNFFSRNGSSFNVSSRQIPKLLHLPFSVGLDSHSSNQKILKRTMGATESILYDEAVLPTVTHPRPGMVEPPKRPNPGESGPMRRIPPQHARKRPPQSAKPIKRMEGLVLGGPKTGKRTLLSRLKGVDPFAKDRDELEEANPSITIQYKPPSDSPTWDRIKLRIRYANDMDDDNKPVASNQIDFVVLLISPKNSQEMTQSYLEGVLGMYLDRLGYQNDNDNRESTQNKIDNAKEPFCMAVLFNFRDLEDGRNQEKDSTPSRAYLRRLVETTLRSRNVDESKIVAEFLETSLLNCFGLDGLHRFIYRTYLQRCQTDIEKQLSMVRRQIQLTDAKNSRADDTTDSAKTKVYEEFLKEITPKEEPAPLQAQSQEESDSSQEDPRPQKRNQQEPIRRKMNFRPPTKQGQELRMGRDALEAFLASSSDEEDEKPAGSTSRRKRHPKTGYASSSSSSDDESDDDFFYDESGNRRHQIQNPKAAMIANEREDRKQVIDSESDDSSSSEEVENPSSRPIEKPKDQKQLKQIPQQTSVEKEGDGVRVEESSTDAATQERKATEERTSASENESVDDEHKVESSVSLNETVEREEKVESSPIEETMAVTSLGDGNDDDDDEIREADDDAHVISRSESRSNDDKEAGESLNDRSSEEPNEEVNDKEINMEKDVDDSAVSSAPNKTIDDDDDNDNDNMIDSTHVATKSDEIEDDDDDDNFMIHSAPGEARKDDSDDEDDGYMIGSTPIIENVAQDDDDDDDGYMVNTTPDAKNTEEDDSDDDETDFMIGSTSIENVVVADDDDDDDFIIQSNPIGDENIDTDDSPAAEPPKSPLTKKPEPAPESSSTPTSSGGISQAALAAIAAAQQEAEAMMRQQQYSQIPSDMVKEKKSKKKKKDEKKKKKKKKSRDVDGS